MFLYSKLFSSGRNSGNTKFAFKVSRPFGTTGTTTVMFATAAGTATAGTDYTTKTGTVTLTAGQQLKTVTIIVKGDTTVEPNEKFNVRLSNLVVDAVLLTTRE